MKSFLLSTVVMLSLSGNASVIKVKTEMYVFRQEVQFRKIETNQIPSQVLKQASIKYSGFALQEAFVTDKNEYKLVLKRNDKSVNAYYKSTGEFIKEEARQAKDI